MLDPTFSKMIALARQQDLLREAEQQRLVVLLPRQRMSRQPAKKLVLWLKRFGRLYNEFKGVPLLSTTKACLDQTDSDSVAR